MADTPALPKEELLLKLLRMTTSNNDGECLTAIRKANELLSSARWDWEMLIRAKIKVIADPFKDLGDPAMRASATTTTYNTATTPRQPTPPPPPRMRGTPITPISTAVNRFAGRCFCCGASTMANAGFIFKPKITDTKYQVVCTPCNTSAVVPTYAAAPQAAPKGRRSLSDIA